MTRVKRGNVARKRRNKILDLNRGYRGSHSTLFRTAQQRMLKALTTAYTDRRKKKRTYRRLRFRNDPTYTNTTPWKPRFNMVGNLLINPRPKLVNVSLSL